MNDFSESLVERISTVRCGGEWMSAAIDIQLLQAVEQADKGEDAPASTAVGPSTSGDSASKVRCLRFGIGRR